MPARQRDHRAYNLASHRTLRDHWRPIVAAGNAYCTEPICKKRTRWIPPGTRWDLAHDRVNGGYHGPAHATCNRAEGARYGNRRRRGHRTVTSAWQSPDW